MPLFGNGIDKAISEVRRLKEARVTLADRERKAREELARLRADLPSIALANILGEGPDGRDTPDGNHLPGTTPSYNRILTLELEIRTCVDALPALFPKLEAAMRSLGAARAADLRKKITKLQTELVTHRAETDRLRIALENHESAFFVPAPIMMVADVAAPVMAPTVTRSEKMRQEIAKLEREVIAIEQAAVNVGGGLDATSLSELLSKIDECPDDTIPPTASEVEFWFVGELARANAEWSGTGRRYGDPIPPGVENPDLEKYRTLSVSFVWLKDGVIDTAHSSVKYSNRYEVPRELAAEHGAVYAAPLSD